MKKLMLFSHVCNAASITGAEKLLLFLAKRLSVLYECILVVPNEGRLSQLARDLGARTLVRDIPLLYSMYTPHEHLRQEVDNLIDSTSVKHTVQLLAEEQPDQIFVNTCVHIIPSIAAKSLGIPVVWQITEVIRDNGCRGITASLIDLYSDLIIGISEASIQPFHALSAEKLCLLYPSWNEEDFHPASWEKQRKQKRRQWGVAPEEKLIGYISSYLIAEKGPHHFIESAAELGRDFRHIRFVLIGDKADRDFYRSLERLVQESGCAERFKFVDHVSNVEAAYSAMDIVVIPSIQCEGFGLTAMEGMIVGRPVVAYASGGLEEILRHTGNERYLAAAGNRGELTAKIAQLLEEPGRIETIGKDNRRRIEASFGREAYESRLQQVIERMNQLSRSVIPLPEHSEAVSQQNGTSVRSPEERLPEPEQPRGRRSSLQTQRSRRRRLVLRSRSRIRSRSKPRGKPRGKLGGISRSRPRVKTGGFSRSRPRVKSGGISRSRPRSRSRNGTASRFSSKARSISRSRSHGTPAGRSRSKSRRVA
ncbi:glycosyltransferase [Paenibacillus fonticola]|uniref:glycosyltransferase n=1 Tax=Paenibacillus fonticola TaxID=379896 RepID=UPI00037B31D6|nr:glycosyltransferase [Paenibacillus fonticola]